MKILILSIVSLFLISSLSISFAENEPYVLSHFSAKGVITENNPFGGMVFWTIVDGDKGAVVSSSENGITVFRLDMTQSDSCPDLPDTVCLDATITSIKNSQYEFTEVGNEAKMVFEMPNKQTITMLSGELATLEIEIDLKKMRLKEVAKIVEEDIQDENQQDLTAEAWSKLQEALELTNDIEIQQALVDSNEEFSNVDDPYSLIEQRNDEWIATDEEEVTPFMGTLIGNKASELLREVMNEDKMTGKDFVYEEIILTNAYGANVALTAKTTDYQQWDEQWWILAKNNGVNFETGFDESAGVQSLDMSVRIADADGRFMGIMKFVINAEKIIVE